MDKILELLKPENLRIPLFLLGVALLGRSLATVNPEYGVTILGPEEQPQDILLYFNVEVQRYIMTMLWPLVYALLNSLHPGIKVTKAFFNTVIVLHVFSLIVSLAWYFNYIPNNTGNAPFLDQGLSHMQLYASLVLFASFLSSAFAMLWFNKGWAIFQVQSTENNA